MNINFYLNSRLKADGSAQLYARLHYKNKPLTVYFSFIAIQKCNWDSRKQRCKPSKSFPQAKQINSIINALEQAIEQEVYLCFVNGMSPSQAKEAIAKSAYAVIGVDKSKPQHSLMEALKLFVEDNPKGLKKERWRNTTPSTCAWRSLPRVMA